MMSSSDEEEEEVPSKVCIYWIPSLLGGGGYTTVLITHISLLGGNTPQCRLPTYLRIVVYNYNHKPIDFKYTIHQNINDSAEVGSLKFIVFWYRSCFIDWIENILQM